MSILTMFYHHQVQSFLTLKSYRLILHGYSWKGSFCFFPRSLISAVGTGTENYFFYSSYGAAKCLTNFLTQRRNQRMADDQSVVGRRRIYYDNEHGSEALICSDSEEDMAEPEEMKREFTSAEDKIIL